MSCLIQLLTVVFDATFPVLFSFLTYHRVCNQINTTSATSGAGATSISGASKSIPGFQWGWCYSIFSHMCIFLQIAVCPFLLFLLAIVLSVLLRYTDSDYTFGIFEILVQILLIKKNKKTNKNTTSEQYQNHIHGDKIDTLNTHIGSRLLSQLGTGTLIKRWQG